MIKLTRLQALPSTGGGIDWDIEGPLWLNPTHIASIGAGAGGTTYIGSVELARAGEAQVWYVSETPEEVVAMIKEGAA